MSQELEEERSFVLKISFSLLQWCCFHSALLCVLLISLNAFLDQFSWQFWCRKGELWLGQQHRLFERGKKLMILSLKQWIAGLGNCYKVIPVILGQQHLAGWSNVLWSANVYLVCVCRSDDAADVHFICICLSILWLQLFTQNNRCKSRIQLRALPEKNWISHLVIHIITKHKVANILQNQL